MSPSTKEEPPVWRDRICGRGQDRRLPPQFRLSPGTPRCLLTYQLTYHVRRPPRAPSPSTGPEPSPSSLTVLTYPSYPTRLRFRLSVRTQSVVPLLTPTHTTGTRPAPQKTLGGDGDWRDMKGKGRRCRDGEPDDWRPPKSVPSGLWGSESGVGNS